MVFLIIPSLCYIGSHAPFNKSISQLTFTCSNSTEKTLEEGLKYSHQKDVIDDVLVFFVLILNIFIFFF